MPGLVSEETVSNNANEEVNISNSSVDEKSTDAGTDDAVLGDKEQIQSTQNKMNDIWTIGNSKVQKENESEKTVEQTTQNEDDSEKKQPSENVDSKKAEETEQTLSDEQRKLLEDALPQLLNTIYLNVLIIQKID